MGSGKSHILAIDQGTTSSRAMIFDDQGRSVVSAQKEFTQHFPHDGWVEHDAVEIMATVTHVVECVLDQLPPGADIVGAGITNQRETTIIWDRETGAPIAPAIVWQDRRTADLCRDMIRAGYEDMIREKTGLLLDSYFSATKIKWILDHVAGARERANKGELAFGTVDSFILWHLTGGEVHATDVTNAARTMLFNIQDMAWDADLLKFFEIPAALLPVVRASDHHFGDVTLLGRNFPITAMAGDQQAALIGQNCLEAGQVKCTFGTGGFMMMNLGDRIIRSQNRLLTTVAYQIGGQVAYALEGSFFSAGSAVQWLRDGLGIIDSAHECEALARAITSSAGVVMVPAFTGLGAPHWNPDARGALYGLTRATGRAEIVRAVLESVGFQTADLRDAMIQDIQDSEMSLASLKVVSLKVDGGMVENGWLCQFLADILQMDIIRPRISETTAYGVAMLAGFGAGLFKTVNEMSTLYAYDNITAPVMGTDEVEQNRKNWKKAIKSTYLYGEK